MALSRPRIVVADDSAFMRAVLVDALEECGFDVAGVAKDGDEALALCDSIRPAALSLDLAMPGRDGISVLKELRSRPSAPPVVVVSAFSPAHGARAVDALAEGAFELVAKPAAGEPLTDFVAELGTKVMAAVNAGAVRSARALRRPTRPTDSAPRVPRSSRIGRGGDAKLVVVACSTGGPKALASLLPSLPAPLGAGTLIVQHMPPGFTGSLAQRLDRASALNVREATDGDKPEPGVALIAPGGSHLRLGADKAAKLTADDAIGGLRPRADLTISDAAKVYGDRLLLVVLTGMGRDGLEGAHEVRKRGGRILVEDESTCTVYGMPRAVVEAGLADAVLPLERLASAIASEAGAVKVAA